MRQPQRTLDAGYRARAIPPGSARYWSWLFASTEMRAPLLGVYALSAEWHALMDPATDRSAALIKLGWWQEEMRRLSAGVPVHPISAFLKSLPRSPEVDFAPLIGAIDGVAAGANGAPLERGTDLEPHVRALRAAPLALASRLAGGNLDEDSLKNCTQALAVADYLAWSTADYRREARFGRVPFAIEELLDAGIENADLSADAAPARLQGYLERLRDRAAKSYAVAALALPRACRAQQRHLLVLAALGLDHLQKRISSVKSRGLNDMLLAWRTARRAGK
jgi:15-cis-phytoene synthase